MEQLSIHDEIIENENENSTTNANENAVKKKKSPKEIVQMYSGGFGASMYSSIVSIVTKTT